MWSFKKIILHSGHQLIFSNVTKPIMVYLRPSSKKCVDRCIVRIMPKEKKWLVEFRNDWVAKEMAGIYLRLFQLVLCFKRLFKCVFCSYLFAMFCHLPAHPVFVHCDRNWNVFVQNTKTLSISEGISAWKGNKQQNRERELHGSGSGLEQCVTVVQYVFKRLKRSLINEDKDCLRVWVASLHGSVQHGLNANLGAKTKRN